MGIQEKYDQFFEQVKDKPITAALIMNAVKATGHVPELNPFYLSYAKVHDVNLDQNELDDLTRVHETARQEKAINETAASLAEKSGVLAVEKDAEKRILLIEDIRKLSSSLTKQNKSRIYTIDDYMNECLNYDPSKDFTPALFGGIAFPDGTVSYIGARTSRGKTAAMVNIARESLAAKRKTIFITLEMSGRQIFNKLIFSAAYAMCDAEGRQALRKMASPEWRIYAVWKNQDLPSAAARHGEQVPANFFRKCVQTAYEDIRAAKNIGDFILYDGRDATEPEIISFMAGYAEKGTVILLDYIQKMRSKPGTDTDSFRRVQAISYDVATAAVETNAVIIAGAQFNRTGEPDGLGDVFTDQSFRESGDIEQDAQNAIGIGWKLDKQGRFYEVLKTREDKKQGMLFDLDFCGEYSYMNHGKQIFRSQGRPSSANDRGKKKPMPTDENTDDNKKIETPPQKQKILTRADILGKEV